jgi:hypothetical protein
MRSLFVGEPASGPPHPSNTIAQASDKPARAGKINFRQKPGIAQMAVTSISEFYLLVFQHSTFFVGH